MKSALVLLALTFGFAAQATEIFTTQNYSNAQGVVFSETYRGFQEDGFNTNFTACYQGRVEGVCKEIDRAQNLADAQYGDGGHGRFEVSSCVVNGENVELQYTQVTDYGDTDVDMTLGKCAL